MTRTIKQLLAVSLAAFIGGFVCEYFKPYQKGMSK